MPMQERAAIGRRTVRATRATLARATPERARQVLATQLRATAVQTVHHAAKMATIVRYPKITRAAMTTGMAIPLAATMVRRVAATASVMAATGGATAIGTPTGAAEIMAAGVTMGMAGTENAYPSC